MAQHAAGTYVRYHKSDREHNILVKMIWALGANVMPSFLCSQTDVNSKRNGLFLCTRDKNFYEKSRASSLLFATASYSCRICKGTHATWHATNFLCSCLHSLTIFPTLQFRIRFSLLIYTSRKLELENTTYVWLREAR